MRLFDVVKRIIAINQEDAWRALFRWIESDEFVLTADKTCELYGIAGKVATIANVDKRNMLILC